VRELAKLRALTAEERRLLLFCLAAFPVVSAAVAMFGFRRARQAMGWWPRQGGARYDGLEAAARARRVAYIVSVASRRGAVSATCLRRSLLLWWILRHDGIPTVLRVGVNRDGGFLNAHAWVEHAGVPLGDAPDVALRFPAFERDFSASAERAS
jgi:hypothetical protein